MTGPDRNGMIGKKGVTMISRRLFLFLVSAGRLGSVWGKEKVTDKTVRIHFLHHSTGRNLIDGAGGIYGMFDAYNQMYGTDYRFSDEWSIPSEENFPYDYYRETFSLQNLQEYARKYHIVIWKHCYPGSGILEDTGNASLDSSRKSIENYTLQYRALRDRFDSFPDTQFMAWTLPPLHRMASTAEMARRATDFSAWITTEFPTESGAHPNLWCFDFRDHVTGEDNFLREDYERLHDDSDSHPNDLANDTVCPLFFKSIIDCIEWKSISVQEQGPTDFHVAPARPNPFNPSTTIEYRLPVKCHVTLTIHDILGRKTAVLQDGMLPAGKHMAAWNGKDMRGNIAASGTYLYLFTAGRYRNQGKLTLVR